MSKIKNGGLDQYGTETFKQQQFGTAGIEGVNAIVNQSVHGSLCRLHSSRAMTYFTEAQHTYCRFFVFVAFMSFTCSIFIGNSVFCVGLN